MAGAPVVAGRPQSFDPIASPPKWLIERWRQQDQWVRFAVVAIALAPLLLAVNANASYLFFAICLTAPFFLPQEFALATVVVALLALSLHAGFNRTYVDVLRFVILLVGSAVLVWRSSRVRIRFPATSRTLFYGGFICHIAVALISTIVSDAPLLTFGKVLLLIACWAACSAVVGTIVGQHGSKAAERISTALTLLIGPFLLASFIVYPLSSVSATGETFTTSGFRGLTANPNSLGVCAALMAPLLMANFARNKTAWTQFDLARALGVVALVFLVVVSRSRASGLALATSVFVLVVLLPRSRLVKYYILAGYFCVCIVLTNPYSYVTLAQNWIYKGDTTDELFVSRSELWRTAREDFQERPLLGRGYGVTTTREADFSSVRNYLLIKVEQGSSFWALLTQVGILGFLPLALGLLDLLIRAAKFAARVKDPYLTAILAAAAGLIADSIFEAWIVAPGSGLLWVLLTFCATLDAVLSRMKPGRLGAAQHYVA